MRWRWHPEILTRSLEAALLGAVSRHSIPELWRAPEAECLRALPITPGREGEAFRWWDEEWDEEPLDSLSGERLCAWGIRCGLISLNNWALTKEVLFLSTATYQALLRAPLMDPMPERNGPTLYVALETPLPHQTLPEAPPVLVLGFYLSLQEGNLLFSFQEVCPALPGFTYGLMLHPFGFSLDLPPVPTLDPVIALYQRIYRVARSLYFLYWRQTLGGEEDLLLPSPELRPTLRRDSTSRREREAARERLPWTWRSAQADLPRKLLTLRRPSTPSPKSAPVEERATPGLHHVSPFLRRTWVRDPAPGEEPEDIKEGKRGYLFQVARPVAEGTGGFWRGEGRPKTVRGVRVEGH